MKPLSSLVLHVTLRDLRSFENYRQTIPTITSRCCVELQMYKVAYSAALKPQ